MHCFIFTCNGREDYLTDTLLSVERSDWNYPVTVTHDNEAIEFRGKVITSKNKRANANARYTVAKAASHNLKWFLLLEDDCHVNKHLQHNIESWGPLRSGSLAYGGLFTGVNRRHSFGEGMFWYSPDSSKTGGLVGAVLSGAFAEFVTRHWDDYGDMSLDHVLARAAGSNKCGRFYRYWPSIVDHRGFISAANLHPKPITTFCYSPEFRHP